MAKFTVNRVNQIFSDNKLRDNQASVDASLTSAAIKKAMQPKASVEKSPVSIMASIMQKRNK